MKGGYIIVRTGSDGSATATSVPGRVRRGRRRRPRVPAGHHLGRHRLHGGARRGQVPRAVRRRATEPAAARPLAPAHARASGASPRSRPRTGMRSTAAGNPFLEPRVPRRTRDVGLRRRRQRLVTAATCCCAMTTGRLVGAVPRYLKAHSWGEFIFDWSWAQSYARAGLDYYPKHLAAVPFTPVTGPRLLVRGDAADAAAVRGSARRSPAAGRGPRPASPARTSISPPTRTSARSRTRASCAARLPLPVAQPRLPRLRRLPRRLPRGQAQESCAASGGALPSRASSSAACAGEVDRRATCGRRSSASPSAPSCGTATRTT